MIHVVIPLSLVAARMMTGGFIEVLGWSVNGTHLVRYRLEILENDEVSGTTGFYQNKKNGIRVPIYQ